LDCTVYKDIGLENKLKMYEQIGITIFYI
jgi:hypothetical protein